MRMDEVFSFLDTIEKSFEITQPYLETLSIMERNNNFAEMLENSQFQDTLVNVASQVASITEIIQTTLPLNGMVAASQLLADYCDQASRQYEMIQQATEQDEINWRLDVLGLESKFIDRQTSWILDLTEKLPAENDLISEDSTEEQTEEIYEAKPSAFMLIPTHIGYTRREDVRKTPAEALEDSSIVSITEKGKKVSESILTINQLMLDRGENRIFGFSESVVRGMLDFGLVVCTNIDEFGMIIDELYFAFYENLEHIKLLIGGGDKKKGDSIVRNDDIYQCIFDVKTIRSDLRHDLDHGTENDRRKKHNVVGNCYKQYCGSRPLRERDFKKIQEKLYDKILLLEDSLIQILTSK